MQQTNKIPNFNCCFSKESDDNACSLSTSCETLIFGRFNGDKNSVCACVDFVYYFSTNPPTCLSRIHEIFGLTFHAKLTGICFASSTTTVKNWHFFRQWGNNITMSLFSKAELEGIEKGGFVCDGFLKFLIWIHTMHSFWGGEKGVGGSKKNPSTG